MRRYLYLAIVAATALLTTLPAAAASADTTGVLTYGTAAGPDVAVNDVLTAGLASAAATFYSSATGTTGVSCSQSTFTASVTANPTAPGTAEESLTGQTFDGCTANVPGVTSVGSITLNNLPYISTVSSDGTVTISESSDTTPLKTTIVLNTILGSVTCVYTATSISGVSSNTANTIQFTSQQFTKSSGPGTCFASGFFSATYGPVIDTTQGNAPVFVN